MELEERSGPSVNFRSVALVLGVARSVECHKLGTTVAEFIYQRLPIIVDLFCLFLWLPSSCPA